MPSKAIATVLGHAGKAAEFRDVARGLTVFSVAVSKSRKLNTGEWEETTTWFNIKCWGEYGKKLVGKLHKGDLVQVTGELSLDKWTGKDGTDMTTLVVTADPSNVLCLTKHEHGAPAAKVSQPIGTINPGNDDLPF